jgi:hypothetical protein
MTIPTIPYRTIGDVTTIGDVIAQMDQVIERCIRERSRLGYFAMLYRNVTVRVRDAITAGRFEDGPRMERLDVIFANQYLDALDRFWRGEQLTASWSVAFRTARRRSPIILQHLLLGMNAHINFDLAIAAVQTSPGSDLPGLKRDFFEITVLLGEMIDSVQERIDQVSPWFGIIDHVGGRTDEQICAFAIKEARNLAWQTAEELAVAAPEKFEREIALHDQVVAELGRRIRSPGRLVGAALYLIRVRESNDVPAVIEALRM